MKCLRVLYSGSHFASDRQSVSSGSAPDKKEENMERSRARSASMCRSEAETHYLKNESKIPLETVGKGSLYEGLPVLWVVLACI